MDGIVRIYEQFDKRAPFRLEDATLLVLAKIGSHSHNTFIPNQNPHGVDDVDYMMVVIPPASYITGVKMWEGMQFQHEELDVVVYSFSKFMHLLMKSNPNVLSLLWLEPQFYLLTNPFMWNAILAQRQIFSSKRATASFLGYADAQLKRMTSFDIETQNEWDVALDAIRYVGYTKEQIVNNQHRNMPSEALLTSLSQELFQPIGWHYGVASAAGWSLLTPQSHAGYIDFGQHLLDQAIAAVKRIHAKHFQGYMGDKRKTLVRQYGYDTKNAAHLVRLMRMCCEFLETGKFNVFRTTDAEELKDIKTGKWTLEQVHHEAMALRARAKDAERTTLLPDAPDIEAIDKLTQRIHFSALTNNEML